MLAKVISTAMQTMPDKILRPLLISYATTYLAPSHNLFRQGAVLVNLRGERFCDELDRPQDNMGRQPGQQAFILFDQDIAAKFEAWPNFISTAPGVGYAYLADYRRSRRDFLLRGTDLGRSGARNRAARRGAGANDSGLPLGMRQARPPRLAASAVVRARPR